MTDSAVPEVAARLVDRRARLRRILLHGLANGAGAMLSLLTVGGLLLFAERREAAQRVAQDVLVGFGAESSFELRTLDSTGLSGRLRVGPANAPDLIVDDLQLAGDLSSPWTGDGFGFQPTAIRMTRPRLRVRFDGRRLSFGALDPLIDAALRRPEGDGPSPVILLDEAEVLLTTPAGTLRLTGDAGLADDRLRWLEARLAPATLAQDGARATLRNGALSVRTAGDRLRLRGQLSAPSAAIGEVQARTIDARLVGELPYPDTRTLTVTGPVRLRLALRGSSAGTGAAQAVRPDATVTFDGGVAGDLRRMAFSGRADIALAAASVEGGGVRTRGADLRASLSGGRVLAAPDRLRLSGALAASGRLARASRDDASASNINWSGSVGRLSVRSDAAGRRFAGRLALSSRIGVVRAGVLSASGVTADGRADLALLNGQSAPVTATIRAATLRLPLGGTVAPFTDATLTANGRARLGDAPALDVRGGLSAAGGFDAAEATRLASAAPLLGGQPTHAGALASALRGYRLSAPAVRLYAAGDRLRIGLDRPAEVVSRGGARLTLAASGGELLAVEGLTGRAAVSLALSGDGLPGVDVVAPALTISPSGASGPLRVAITALELAPASGVALTSAGRLHVNGASFVYAPAACAPMTAERIELGDNDLTAVSGRFCPTAGPVLASTANGVRLAGRAEALAFDASTLQAEVRDASADVRLVLSDAGADGTVRLSQAVVRDAADDVRFLPLGLTGEVEARGRRWTGQGRLRAVGGVEIARLDLTQDTLSGTGGVVIEADAIRFSPDGLQPGDLSPVAGALLRNATGEAAFSGRLDWTAAGATSGGVLTLRDLDFRSPAGPVDNLSGRIELVSLAPIVSAPDQMLSAEQVSSVVPLTGVEVRLQVIDEQVRIAGGGFAAAGGRVVVEPTVLPFAEEAITGAVTLAGVNVGAVFETTDLADRIRIDAPVSGRIPFTITAGRIRFSDARLTSDRPGRIAIARSALTGLSAAEASTAPTEPVNAVQDFAYQALENLAFDELLLTVATREDGRLGLDFRVRGRFDPPERQEARVPLIDLIRGSAFQRRIPLPSGTGVNLNLDTSLNLDELLSAYAALQGGEPLRSEPVQPAPAITPPTPPLEGGEPR